MIKLNLGCGKEQKEGYVNVDSNTHVKPDVIDNAAELSKFDEDSVDVIESYHLLEHLTLRDAKKALRVWFKKLKSGGKLIMELPNLRRCCELLLNKTDEELDDGLGYNLAVIGIYGWPPDIKKNPKGQQHKWGWTPESLSKELVKVGFVKIGGTNNIEQKWRKAYKVRRDMRVTAFKP